MIIDILWVVLGLTLLIFGGDFLVKGAVGIAAKAKLSKLVIGMTVVAFGTSSPELIVSLQSASQGFPEIAIGNVMGSNIANLGLVLGITVLIFPMPVSRNSIRYDWPTMMIATLLFWIFISDLQIQRWEGIVLFAILIAFIIFIIVKSRSDQKNISSGVETNESVASKTPFYNHLFFLGLGFVGLYFGSNLLVGSSVSLAKELGWSNHVIGITVVAFGTSVPELATSCVAAYKKETDISVGNLIGSNIFNLLAVLGLTSIVDPIPVESEVLSYDIFWVVGISLLLFPMMIYKRKIGRIGGVALLGIYVTYIALLF